MANLSDQDRQAIENAIFAGRKIEALKLHREATGSGLADAKQAVEDLEVDLRHTSPEKFIRGAEKRGCFGLLLCVVLVLIGTLLVSHLILR